MDSILCCRRVGHAGRFGKLPRTDRAGWQGRRWSAWSAWSGWAGWTRRQRWADGGGDHLDTDLSVEEKR